MADPRTYTDGTTELAAFKYGKALLDSARSQARHFTATAYEDLRFALGETQWPTPSSYRAWFAERWKNRSVRNYTFATIHYKVAMCTQAEPSIRCVALDELSTAEERASIEAAVTHELDRLRWRDYIHDAMFDGAVMGKGIIHVYPMRDDFTGMYYLNLESVDPSRYYPDPAKSKLKEARYLVYEPELDMAMIRKMFPDTWQTVKPKDKTIGRLGDIQYSRTDDEIIYGPATGEITVTKDGYLAERKANVAFIWIKDPTVVDDLKTVLDQPPTPGFKCADCGNDFTADGAAFSPPTERTMPRCPECMSANLTPMMTPPLFTVLKDRARLYPFGRLIALTDSGLLYDGPSEYELSGVFPFVEYNHYRIPRRYWGYGDVALCKSPQQALNKHISQAIDYMRLAGNSPMEVPAEVQAYRHLGTIPGDTIPVPAAFMGMARYLSPGGYNAMFHQVLDQALLMDFQRTTGVTDVASGIAPNAPTSGIEVQSRQAAANTRLGDHMRELNSTSSDLASITYEMMHQFYTEPRAFSAPTPNGELYPIAMEVAQLPVNVSVVVTASLDKQQKDNLFGQNLMAAVQSGQIPFMPDLMLPMMGGDRETSREIADRAQQAQQQLQAASAQQALLPGPQPAAAPEAG
jgi:hypothetical protein